MFIKTTLLLGYELLYFVIPITAQNVKDKITEPAPKHTTEHIINFDFQSKSISFPQNRIKKGDPYILTIDNINLNLYNVIINKKDSIISSDIQFPTVDLLGLDAIEKVASGIIRSTMSVTGKKIFENEDVIEKERIKLSKKSQEAGDLKNRNIQKKGELDSISNLIDSSQNKGLKSKIESIAVKIKQDSLKRQYLLSEIDILEQKIVILSNENIQLLAAYSTDSLSIVKDQIALTKDLLLTQIDFSKSEKDKIETLITNVYLRGLNYYQSLYKKPDNPLIENKDLVSLHKILEESKEISARSHTILNNVKKTEKTYLDFSKLYETIYNRDSAVKKLHGEIMKDFSQTKSALDSMIDKITLKRTAELLSSIIHLDNNSARSYTSLPMQLNGDMSKLSIDIVPKKPEFGQTYAVVYEFPHNKNYVGIGGAFYHATGKSFRNDIYSVQEFATSDTTSQFRIVNEDSEGADREIGFATLLHVGTKITNFCKDLLGVHFTIGPAISLASTPQVRLAMGGGLSVGRNKNMVSIDLLGMAGNVQRKSNLYSENQAYDKFPEQITVSKLKTSFAIAVGYIYKF
ncbi:hypothetical protein [Gynurincola endophyticus]|uniref:hypothetical protein n=1 Tax=Gynurincola endophyticus TaxID=2479004 RepID=UPI000F8D2D7A|nr:hypothetical protein [Gynurincola endophyticus]